MVNTGASTTFSDLEGRQVSLENSDILNVTRVQNFMTLEIETVNPILPRLDYGIVGNTEESMHSLYSEESIQLPFHLLRSIWGSISGPIIHSDVITCAVPSTSINDRIVKASPKIVPLAVKFTLRMMSKDILSFISRDVNPISVIESFLDKWRILTDGQIVYIPSFAFQTADPTLQKDLLDRGDYKMLPFSVASIYGYVRAPDTTVYQIERVGVGNISGGKAGGFLFDLLQPTEDAPNTVEDFFTLLLVSIPPPLGWESNGPELEAVVQEVGNAISKGTQTGDISSTLFARSITGAFPEPITNVEEIMNLRNAPLSKAERAHWSQTLRGLPQQKEISPGTSKKQYVGIYVLTPNRTIPLIFRYSNRTKRWVELAQVRNIKSKLPPMTDSEFISYLQSDPDIKFFALGDGGEEIDIIPKKRVTFNPNVMAATFPTATAPTTVSREPVVRTEQIQRQ